MKLLKTQLGLPLIIILFFAVCTLTVLLGSSKVFACSVAEGWPPSGEENYERSETVFVGTVLSVKRDEDINGNIYISFIVNEGYKGVSQGTVEVTTGGNSAMCGYDDMNTFSVGSVWAIYASNNLYTTSVASNKQYKNIAAAIQEVDSFAGIASGTEEEIFCTEQYDPVCGIIDTGIRCITTPCPSSEQKTFSNSCYLQRAGAALLHKGACKEAPVVPEIPLPPAQKPVIPNNCARWYDGCNWCSRSEIGGPAMCTLRACLQQEESYCEAFFTPTQDVPEIENVITVVEDNTRVVEEEEESDIPVSKVNNQNVESGFFSTVTAFFRTLGNFIKNIF